MLMAFCVCYSLDNAAYQTTPVAPPSSSLSSLQPPRAAHNPFYHQNAPHPFLPGLGDASIPQPSWSFLPMPQAHTSPPYFDRVTRCVTRSDQAFAHSSVSSSLPLPQEPTAAESSDRIMSPQQGFGRIPQTYVPLEPFPFLYESRAEPFPGLSSLGGPERGQGQHPSTLLGIESTPIQVTNTSQSYDRHPSPVICPEDPTDNSRTTTHSPMDFPSHSERDLDNSNDDLNRYLLRVGGMQTCIWPGCTKKYEKTNRARDHVRTHTAQKDFACASHEGGCYKNGPDW